MEVVLAIEAAGRGISSSILLFMFVHIILTVVYGSRGKCQCVSGSVKVEESEGGTEVEESESEIQRNVQEVREQRDRKKWDYGVGSLPPREEAWKSVESNPDFTNIMGKLFDVNEEELKTIENFFTGKEGPSEETMGKIAGYIGRQLPKLTPKNMGASK